MGNLSQNQTNFSFQAPTIQAGPSASISPQQQELNAAHRLQRRRVALMLMGIVLIALAISFLISSFTGTRPQEVEDKTLPEVKQEVIKHEVTLKDQILQLRSDLEAADPSQSKLLFPQVDDEIRLDTKKR